MKRQCCSPPRDWQPNHLLWPRKRNLTTEDAEDTEAHRGHLGIPLCSPVLPVVKVLANDMPQELNYWLTTVQMPAPPALPLPDSTDVAVIGAGFTGLSAALSLAKRGAKVVVLESETIGWGARSRNGGMGLTAMWMGANTIMYM